MTDENFKFEIGDEVTVEASAGELSRIWVPPEANGKSGTIYEREISDYDGVRYYIHSPDECLNRYYVLESMLVPASHSNICTNENNFDVLFN